MRRILSGGIVVAALLASGTAYAWHFPWRSLPTESHCRAPEQDPKLTCNAVVTGEEGQACLQEGGNIAREKRTLCWFAEGHVAVEAEIPADADKQVGKCLVQRRSVTFNGGKLACIDTPQSIRDAMAKMGLGG